MSSEQERPFCHSLNCVRCSRRAFAQEVLELFRENYSGYETWHKIEKALDDSDISDDYVFFMEDLERTLIWNRSLVPKDLREAMQLFHNQAGMPESAK